MFNGNILSCGVIKPSHLKVYPEPMIHSYLLEACSPDEKEDLGWLEVIFLGFPKINEETVL